MTKMKEFVMSCTNQAINCLNSHKFDRSFVERIERHFSLNHLSAVWRTVNIPILRHHIKTDLFPLLAEIICDYSPQNEASGRKDRLNDPITTEDNYLRPVIGKIVECVHANSNLRADKKNQRKKIVACLVALDSYVKNLRI